jgi:hypothetical protein
MSPNMMAINLLHFRRKGFLMGKEMNMSSMTVGLETANRLRVEIGGQWISASATELEALISQLSKLREQMTPEVPRTLGSTIPQGFSDPVWASVSHEMAPERILPIRHPGIGWISFLFSPPEAGSLAAYLTKGPPRSGDRLQSLQ